MTLSQVIKWATDNIDRHSDCVNANTDWCNIFATYNINDDVNKYSCTRAVADWKILNKYGNTAKVGSLMYFKNLDDIYGDIDHVGIVIDVNGTKITTIEGNTHGTHWSNSVVGKYTYDLIANNNIIDGFAYPTYDNPDTSYSIGDVVPIMQNYSTDLVNTQLYPVELIQSMLNHVTDAHLICDGYYGSLTRSAVINYQKSVGLDADGIAGVNTITSLVNEVF